MTEKTNTAACRLNTDQMRLLDMKAREKGLPRSMYIKDVILRSLDEDVEHINILQAALMNVQDEIRKTNQKLEFFQQMFYSWLVNWFASNPKPDNVSETFIKESIARRDAFAKNFADAVYNDTTELFEMMFAENVENQNIENEDIE